MGFVSRQQLRVCVALAAVVAAAGGALAGGARPAPGEPPLFADISAAPLVEALNAPHEGGLPSAYPQSIAPASVDLGAFQRLADRRALTLLATPPGARPAPTPAEAAPNWTPPPALVRSPGLPPDRVPTAVARAVDRLIVGIARVNPLGEGDWGAARAAIGAFYADRGFLPVWVNADGLTAAGRAATAQIARAPEDGLAIAGLDLPGGLAGPLDPEALAAAEIAVAAGVVAYAELASGSRLDPARVSPLFADRPEVADPGEALAEVAGAADPGVRLAAYNPPQKGYKELRQALNRLNDAARDGEPGPDGAAPGLGVVSDAPAISDDPLLGEPRKRARTSRRRAELASAGPEAARGAAARRRSAILANLEMWRWEPRDMGEWRIEVNIPDYSVTVMNGEEVAMSSRVVVGKPGTPTPVFSGAMRYVLINPSWRIPDSITKKEILPRLDHFTQLGYEVRTVAGRVVVRQPPGDDNALGRLAFMFPNDHSVYLHDTPARELFGEDMRALSHGCVRVEDPERLAELVLRWSESRVEAAIGGPERTVFLPRPLPIHIEYFTEFVDGGGELEERPDVYGLTQRVARILSAKSQD
jgi:murein L,D-transpeptidase YcbB/YkuD